MEHTHPYSDIFPICAVLCGREMYHCFDDDGTERGGGTSGVGDRGSGQGWE